MLLRLYPPFLGAGIRVCEISNDFKYARVEMPLTRFNRNYVGTHFGGSLYSMVDPFFMIMIIENLGQGFIVWDKAATIRFKKPGRGTVSATFKLSDEKLNEIREKLKTQDKLEEVFHVQVVSETGETVAEVDKVIYIRKK